MPDLHETHRWTDRTYYGETVPWCPVCRSFGFEDVPAAFAECPGPPEKPGKKKDRTSCPVKMESLDDPGHQHSCIGGHEGGDHLCQDCRRWYNVRPDSPLWVP